MSMMGAPSVRFHAPLRRVSLRRADLEAGQHAAALEKTREAAYEQGFADAKEWMTQQLAEQRADVIMMQEQVIRAFASAHEQARAELTAALPTLALEIVRRLCAGFEPDHARLEGIIRESLGELSPGTPDVEIALSPGDLALMGKFDPQLAEKYPGLRFTALAALRPGDCLVRSGFGLIDATLNTKLQNLAAALK